MLFTFMGWNTVGAVREPPLQTQRAASPHPLSASHPLPTLARLSFWVPPQRMSEFEAAYREKVAPILKAHGLTESSERGRATPDSVFSRLFELKTPLEVEEKGKALLGDAVWKATVQSLGAAFVMAGRDTIRYDFMLYATPAGQGKTMPAGPGKAVPAGPGTGHWRTYDPTDGLANGVVFSMLQDREGYLWFGTQNGLSRYDGQTWTTFTTKDGLAANGVGSILQDREGNLWFGTSGRVSRYDGQTFTTFTTRNGLADNRVNSILQDREGNLWFSTYGGGVSRYDGKTWITFTAKDGLMSNSITRSIFQDREGHLWFGTQNGVSRYDGKTWTTFTAKDGLANNTVLSIFQDREGYLWFGTQDGVSRYDGKTWVAFTTKGELASNTVLSILQDREGYLWFGTNGGGLSRYDGNAWTTFTNETCLILQDREGHLWFRVGGVVDRGGGVSRYDRAGRRSSESSGMGTFTTFTMQDGLPSDQLGWFGSVFQDREGNLWFGTNSGVSRYDGKTFTTFTTQDGLPSNRVGWILQDREGVLWFGTVDNGVCRYDGNAFTTFTTADGLAGNWVRSMFQDREGNLWIGAFGGVSRYDGKSWTTFIPKDGPASDIVRSIVRAIFQDREGHLWFGTQNGVSRYDGKTWTTFTTQDGLAANYVHSIFQDQAGHLWFSAWSGGLSRYDGKTWTTLTTKDGLASNGVLTVCQDREGNLWLGTESGVTRYRPPSPSPPPVFVDAVVADRRYEKLSQLAIPSTVKLTAFEFHAISFKTRPEAMIYRYRLDGYDKDWQNTHDRRVEYQNLPRGDYTFEVQAVDRDLVYSEKPATVALRVHLPYERIGWMSALGVALALIAYQAGRIIQRDRRLQEANAALSAANKELFQANVQIQEATRRKSAFLASMSHELRTPMNAIMGFTNLVLRRSGDVLPERQRDNLTKVKLSADHLLSLINDILDLSKVEAGRVDIKAAPFDVKALIEGCCATVGPLVRSGVQLNPEVSEEIGEAHTDEARLRQVVINLLSNALKFTESGEVKISVQALSPRPPLPYTGEGENPSTTSPLLRAGEGWRAAASRGEGLSPSESPLEDKTLEIAVSDTGVGIPADALGYIFDEFRQVEGAHQQQKGTGLGLSITKKLTELLGGTINVESEMGKGSTFTVRVPTVYSGQKA